MCKEIELDDQSSHVEDLARIPTESKGERVRQYLESLAVTTASNVGNTVIHPQAS